MNLVKKGAEGDIFVTKYQGTTAIIKTRKKKPYRNPSLDDRIRRQRTTREATILAEAKSFGIRTPLVYAVNTADCTILMQYIKGPLVRNLKGQRLVNACKEIGKITGILHKNGIMHGDLTTSNFIVNKNKVHIVDFGLSQKTSKIEDHAVDLRLFKEILGSAHVDMMERLWPSFLSGYRTIVGVDRFNKVLNYVATIESRGRYAQVV